MIGSAAVFPLNCVCAVCALLKESACVLSIRKKSEGDSLPLVTTEHPMFHGDIDPFQIRLFLSLEMEFNLSACSAVKKKRNPSVSSSLFEQATARIWAWKDAKFQETEYILFRFGWDIFGSTPFQLYPVVFHVPAQVFAKTRFVLRQGSSHPMNCIPIWHFLSFFFFFLFFCFAILMRGGFGVGDPATDGQTTGQPTSQSDKWSRSLRAARRD